METVYLDTTRPISERVNDLVSQMTLDEKLSQMTNRAAAIPRLGIAAYGYDGEASHGIVHSGSATVFPHAIATAATWDTKLVERIGIAISDEARAKHHAALNALGYSRPHQGLTFWTPNINIFRDPRWGRGQETYGEDPLLTGMLAAAFVRGLQGDHPRYLKVAACAKHFAAHSGPEALRYEFDARVSPRDLEETYLPAFKKLVTEARVESVMPAYNRLNGEPCCGSHYLLVEVLRGEWHFEGYIVSDCGAIGTFHTSHGVTTDAAESAALGIHMGCDLECGDTYTHLKTALERGLISESDVDRCLARTLTTRFKLGMFDPPSEVPYAAIPLEVINSDAHRQLAYEAAIKSAVLLKNQDHFLPLPDEPHFIYIVGPTAADVHCLLGNYNGLNQRMTTLLEGIVGAAHPAARIMYRPGCGLTEASSNPQEWSIQDIRAADVVIACFGLSPTFEGEHGDPLFSPHKGDRPDLSLPPVQETFLRALADSGAKIVLITTGGSPITLNGLEDAMQAILHVWYPGQEGGRAVGDLLFGKAVPGGKLPITFPRTVEQLPAFDDYRMDNRTYRFSTAEPLFPFGFGLSYSRFVLSDLTLEKNTLSTGEACILDCTLSNAGDYEADEVVQVYLRDIQASTRTPLQKLVGFQRVRLLPGEQTRLRFTVLAEQMMLVDEQGARRLEAGGFQLSIGTCLPSARGEALGAPPPLATVFTVIP